MGLSIVFFYLGFIVILFLLFALRADGVDGALVFPCACFPSVALCASAKRRGECWCFGLVHTLWPRFVGYLCSDAHIVGDGE